MCTLFAFILFYFICFYFILLFNSSLIFSLYRAVIEKLGTINRFDMSFVKPFLIHLLPMLVAMTKMDEEIVTELRADLLDNSSAFITRDKGRVIV